MAISRIPVFYSEAMVTEVAETISPGTANRVVHLCTFPVESPLAKAMYMRVSGFHVGTSKAK